MSRLARRRIGFAALALAALPCEARAGDGECFADWSVAAPIVRSEGLTTVGELSAAARVNLKGDIVKTTLCKEDGRYVYRLVVRNAKGELSNLTVDARSPWGR